MNFYGQWDPPVDQVLYENYFHNTRNGFFIECGAGTGNGESRFFEESMDWDGVLIEASPLFFDILSRSRPNATCINAALSNQDGEAMFMDVYAKNGCKGWGNGSLNHKGSHLNELRRYNCEIKSVMVKTMTYKTLISTLNINTVDLLVLDVEGNENIILETMDNYIMPMVMCLEYPYGNLKELQKKLESLGYRYDFVSFNNAFFSRGMPYKSKWFGETNVFHVREDGTYNIPSTK